VFYGCWNYWCLSWWIIKQKKVPEYPTSWVFEKNIEKVLEVLKFLKMYARDRNILIDVIEPCTKNEATKTYKISNEYNAPSDTFHIDYSCEYKVWEHPETYVYINRVTKKPYRYHFTCHLHITIVDSNHTRVKIYIKEPHLWLWEPCIPSLDCHSSGIGSWIPKYVKPTTLEAYAILLTIGKALGEDHKMPPLKLPEK